MSPGREQRPPVEGAAVGSGREAHDQDSMVPPPRGPGHDDRPPLDATAEAHACHLADAHAAVDVIGRAQQAVRLLEVVDAGSRCPAVRAPRYLAAQLCRLAGELDEETGHLRALVAVSDGVLPVGDTRGRAA